MLNKISLSFISKQMKVKVLKEYEAVTHPTNCREKFTSLQYQIGKMFMFRLCGKDIIITVSSYY